MTHGRGTEEEEEDASEESVRWQRAAVAYLRVRGNAGFSPVCLLFAATLASIGGVAADDLAGLSGEDLSPVRADPTTSVRDHVLFDRFSRAEYGPIGELFAGDTPVETEVNDRQIEVAGLYELGTSFGIDGSLVTSDLNFHRIFPDRKASHVDLGLVQLDPGADPQSVRDRIVSIVPGDVDVLTQQDFITREIRYWNESTAIGFIFGFGVIMGIVVGTIIVYQILFSDVQDSLAEYATLKAMGYPHRYLVGVVMREAILLACLAYLPAICLTMFVYVQAGAATNLPIFMTLERAITVFLLTVVMCCSSAGVAIRKLRSAQPAEIF